ncbi:DUF1302 domain-containing protein, partial [Burkholderia ubonensis]|uniref:DUF1302 domain-containing protein n=1 Tax=Burkholderia ubonensis TaxID=101571 RepID=UPI000B16CECA
MKAKQVVRRTTISIAVLGAATSSAYGYDFTMGEGAVQGSWVTNLTAGAGIRTKRPSCSLTGDPNAYGCGAAANTNQWGYGDNGDLNYRKGQPFSTYISATSELLLKMPSEGLKFMVRGTGMYDFLAGNTARTPLSSTASAQVVYNAQLLDLWVQKDFTIGGRNAHVRLGNQVINWGESVFAQSGINTTNSLDTQKLLIPGTQLKQALLPAPMLSVAADLSHGFSTEAYYQFQWNGNRYPPVGSYWSLANVFGRGAEPFTINTNNLNVAGPGAGTIANAIGGGGAAGNSGVLDGIKNGLVNGGVAGPPVNDNGIPVSTQLAPKYRPPVRVKVKYSPRSFD